MPVGRFSVKSRNIRGVVGITFAEGDGLAGTLLVHDGDELVAASRGGQITRSEVSEVRVCGRTAKGVRVMRLDQADVVWSVARIPGDSSHVLAL